MERPVGLCWGSVPAVGLIELADLATRHGFAEISPRPSMYAAGDETRLSDLGVEVGVIDALMTHLPGSVRREAAPANFRRHLLDLDRCLEVAVALRARSLNLAHYLGEASTDPREIATSLREVTERAAEEGIGVCVEFIPGTGVPNLAAAVHIVRLADHAGAGILFDTWHFLRGGGNLEQLEKTPPGLITEVQISDRVDPAADEAYVPMTGRLAPGEGDSPLAELLRVLEQVAPGTTPGLEVFTAETGDAEATVAHLAQATQRFFAGV